MAQDSLLDTFAAKGATSVTNFVADQESVFWCRARRNRLLADWACDLTDEDSQAYRRVLIDADFARSATAEAERWVLMKIRNDLMGFGVFLPMQELADVSARFDRQAVLERQGHSGGR